MNSYFFIPTLSKYFYLARNKNNAHLQLIINNDKTNLIIQNKIVKVYQQTDKCEGNTFIDSILNLNGKIDNKNVIIKKIVKYGNYDKTNNLYLRYLLDCNVDNKYNKIMFNNEYNETNNFIFDNLWYLFSNNTINVLNEINELIHRNKENIKNIEK